MGETSKGFLYILEAMIAALIILSTMVFLFHQSREAPEFYISTLKNTGYDCLKGLDDQNILRDYAINNQTNKIKSELQSCLPTASNYTVTICRQTCTPYSLPQRKNIVKVSYYISGEGRNPDPIQINLYMWSIL